MNLMFEKDLVNKAHLNVALLINGVSKKRFISFVEAIIQKQSWPENLCSCFFHEDGSGGIYEFEADDDEENDILWLPYADVLPYLKFACEKYKELYADPDEIEKIDALIKRLSK